MPRRTHTEETRPVFDSFTTFDNLHDELKRSWRTWQQATAERSRAREQERRIDRFRRAYVDR